MKNFVSLTLVTSLVGVGAYADDLSNANSKDKSQYNLFSPTPSDLLRPMNSDKYDTILDAHTLDAGHIQIEGSLINYYTYSANYSFPGVGIRYEKDVFTWSPRIRVGLLNNLEFEINPSFSHDTYDNRVTFSAPFVPAQTIDVKWETSQFWAVGLGPKLNLWGNDEGPTSLAVHPFVSVPTTRRNWHGGLEVPFGWSLPCGFYLKAETQISTTDNGNRTTYGAFYNGLSVHKSVCSHCDLYCYLSTDVTSQSGPDWIGYSGFGAVCQVTSNLQLFGGLGFGLTSNSYDYNPRFGIVWRY